MIENLNEAQGLGVWTGEELGGKEAVRFELGPAHLAAMETDLRAVRARGLATEAIEKADFPLPAVAAELRELADDLQNGRGLLVIGGFPVDRYGLEDLETLYWGLGTHFGVAVSQSVMGDRLGHVIDVSDRDPGARAYRNRRELSLHTDFSDIVSFLCVRKAATGGLSWFASALAVHNEILARRPDLAAVLYEGFHWHRYGEQGEGAAPVTPWRVPVFSERDGHMSCRYIRGYITEGMAHVGDGTLTAAQTEALDLFDETAHRPGMPIKFMLEPGEAVFTNNFTVLHARERFEDGSDPARKRLLLRLWMTVPGGRPVRPEIQIFDSGRAGGVPPQPGRTPSYARRTPHEAMPESGGPS